jgi:hypothetical protein
MQHCSRTDVHCLLFKFLLLCWVGVHCGIFKGSYNVSTLSYLNSSPPPFSFICTPHLRNSFNRYLFSVYSYVYTVFVPYLPSYTISLPPTPLPLVSTPPPPARQGLFLPLVLLYKRKEKELTFFLV